MHMQRSSLMLMLMLFVAPGLVRCDESPSAAQCEDWSARASNGRRAAQDGASRDCSADADCEVVDYELSCFEDCGYPSAVASSGVSALERAVEAIDKANCDRFDAASCPAPISPPCVAPFGAPSAVCDNGQCTLVFVR